MWLNGKEKKTPKNFCPRSRENRLDSPHRGRAPERKKEAKREPSSTERKGERDYSG